MPVKLLDMSPCDFLYLKDACMCPNLTMTSLQNKQTSLLDEHEVVPHEM